MGVIENEIAKTIFFIFQPQITQKLSVGKIKFLYTIRKVFIWAFRICNKIGPPPYNENSVKHFLILLSFFGTFYVYFFVYFFFHIYKISSKMRLIHNLNLINGYSLPKFKQNTTQGFREISLSKKKKKSPK